MLVTSYKEGFRSNSPSLIMWTNWGTFGFSSVVVNEVFIAKSKICNENFLSPSEQKEVTDTCKSVCLILLESNFLIGLSVGA